MMSPERNTRLRGELLYNEPMARYTSWRTGGRAKRMYKPSDRDDLIAFIQSLPANESIVFVGLGSNLLVRDGGIDGTVICLQGALNTVSIDHETVYAEAGTACAQLARFAAQHGLTASEFFAGIPGTVGGALAMNAGAFGSETWNLVSRVEMMHRFHRLPPPDNHLYLNGHGR